MTSGATEVKKSTLGKNDNTVTIWEFESINLWFNFGVLDTWIFLETSHVDLIIEMTNVSNDGIVLHLCHMVGHDNTLVSSSGDEDVGGVKNALELLDLETLHTGLKSADWIDFSNNNSSTTGFHGSGGTFTNITKTADDDFLTSNHDIGGSHETIWERVSASIDVIELLLGDGIVNVDGLEEELTSGGHLVKSVDTGGCLFGNTNELLGHLGPFVSSTSLEILSDDSNDLLELEVVIFIWIWDLSGLEEVSLGLDTFVDEEGSITTIIDENIWTIAVWPGEHFVGAIPVLLEGLSLPCEDVGGLGLDDSSGGVVLSGEDVARGPSNFGSKFVKSFDQNGGLDGHVEGSRNLSSLEDFRWSILLSNSHESWHLDLSDVEFSSAPISLIWEFDIGFKVGFHLVVSVFF